MVPPTLMGMVLSLRGTGESLRARKMTLSSHASPAAAPWTSTRIVLAEDPAVAAGLAAEGWLCWETDIDAVPGQEGSGAIYRQLLRQLESREWQAWILLDDSARSADVLERLLPTLRADGYNVRLAVESEF